MTRVAMWEVLRRGSLAVACLALPVLVAIFSERLVFQKLVQQQISLPAKSEYLLRDAAVRPDGPDARMKLYASHVAGRYNFAVSTGFVLPLSLFALCFAVVVIHRRAGEVFPHRRAREVFLCAIVIYSFFVTWYMAYNVEHFKHARLLILDNILEKADKHQDLELLKAGSRGTADVVGKLIVFNTWIGLMAVGFVMGAVFLLSVRGVSADLKLDDLKRRLRELRMALILVSSILVLYVLVSKMLLQWPLSLLAETQKLALDPVADAVLFHWSAGATMALMMIFTPAIVSWRLDVGAYRASRNIEVQESSNGKSVDGLEFAPLPTITNILVVLAPLLVSPFADALKAMIGALPGK